MHSPLPPEHDGLPLCGPSPCVLTICNGSSCQMLLVTCADCVIVVADCVILVADCVIVVADCVIVVARR